MGRLLSQTNLPTFKAWLAAWVLSTLNKGDDG